MPAHVGLQTIQPVGGIVTVGASQDSKSLTLPLVAVQALGVLKYPTTLGAGIDALCRCSSIW